MNKKSVFCNIFIFIGLVMIGAGLFFWFGRGPALTIPGALVLSIGVWGAIR